MARASCPGVWTPTTKGTSPDATGRHPSSPQRRRNGRNKHRLVSPTRVLPQLPQTISERDFVDLLLTDAVDELCFEAIFPQEFVFDGVRLEVLEPLDEVDVVHDALTREFGAIPAPARNRLTVLTGLLVGIVALNVLALSFNASSSKATRETDVLNRQISTLRAQIAAAGVSNEHVQAQAAQLGMVIPEPGSIGYLQASDKDAATAAQRISSGEVTAGTPAAADPALTTDTTTTTADPALTTAPVTSPTP